MSDRKFPFGSEMSDISFQYSWSLKRAGNSAAAASAGIDVRLKPDATYVNDTYASAKAAASASRRRVMG